MILPEGITSWNGYLYIGTYNIFSPQDSRIFVFDAHSKQLVNTIGGKPGEELVSAGALLGLTINHDTGDLFAGNNFTGELVRIRNPSSQHPAVSLYATLPQAGAGPEDLNFGPNGRLYSTDSNLGLVWSVDRGGAVTLEAGPLGSGALHSDNGLFASPVAGLAPNGMVFSPDKRHVYVANTYQDSITIFDVGRDGHISSDGRLFAQNFNPDVEEYPIGFEAVLTPASRIGASATTPLNGVDGLAFDDDGNMWAACTFGDNLTVLDGRDGHVIRMVGTSAVTQGGLLNSPAGVTFIGTEVYTTNLGIFTLGGSENGYNNPNLPFTVVEQYAGERGYDGNGNL